MTDHPILQIMYEQEQRVNYTFVMKKKNNFGYVSQLYTGKKIGNLTASKSTPFEQVTQVLHEMFEVSDVDNMPPIFFNQINETTDLIIIKSEINNCRQFGTVINVNAVDGDRYLDEEVHTDIQGHGITSKNGDVFEFDNVKIYCTDKTGPEPYIIDYRATQTSNPQVRTNSMHVVLFLRDLEAESKGLVWLSDASRNVSVWKIDRRCNKISYIIDQTENVKLQLIKVDDSVVLLANNDGLIVDTDGYVIATNHFMESADSSNFSVTAMRIDGSITKFSRQWRSEITLDSIRRNSAGPCVWPNNEGLFEGIVFGFELPAFVLILTLILLHYLLKSMLKKIIDATIDVQYLLPKNHSINILYYAFHGGGSNSKFTSKSALLDPSKAYFSTDTYYFSSEA